MAKIDFKMLKELFIPVLAISKPFVQKIVEEKIIPAIKTMIYTVLQKKKDRAVLKLLGLLAKYKNEENETKKAAHLTGLKLGISALKSIGESMIEAANQIEKEL